MKKTELARRLARQEAITPAAAADQLDDLIFEIQKRFKQGRSASFPGVDRIVKPKADAPAPSKPAPKPGARPRQEPSSGEPATVQAKPRKAGAPK